MIIGLLLAVFGILPLLGGAALAGKAYVNAQQTQVNDEFLPKAWRNMPAEKFFPDRFGHHAFGRQAWARMGIDHTSSCEKPGLQKDLANSINEYGCQGVVRATYVDTSRTFVTTIAVVAFESFSDADELFLEFDRAADFRGYLVHAYPVPDTPAAKWKNKDRGGVATRHLSLFVEDLPYVTVATVGYVDGRPVKKLPEPWTLPSAGSANEYLLDSAASQVLFFYRDTLEATIREDAK